MKFQTILAGFIAQRGAAANGAVKLRPKQPEPAVFTESCPIAYSCHFFTPDIKSFSNQFRGQCIGSSGLNSKKFSFF